jgi:hypothetical protein
MIRHSGKFSFLIIFFVLIIFLISCRPEPVVSSDTTVIILQPSAESILSTSSVTVRTHIQNFVLVDKSGQLNMNGEGHLIFYKDVTPPTVRGQTALTNEGTYVESIEKSFTWENITPGRHVFWVQPVNNDNSCLEPPAAVSVSVSVVAN